MNIRSLTSLTAVLLTVFAALAVPLRPGHCQETIKIGVLHSLSGPWAEVEKPLVSIIELLVREQNEQYRGLLDRRLELLVLDAGERPDVFRYAAQRLVQMERVDVVFGGWTTPSLRAAESVFADNRVLFFFPGPYAPDPPGEYVVYTGRSFQHVDRAIDHLRTLGVRQWIFAKPEPEGSLGNLVAYVAARLRRDSIDARELTVRYGQRLDLPSPRSSLGEKTAILSAVPAGVSAPLHAALAQTTHPSDYLVMSLFLDEDSIANSPTAKLAVATYFQAMGTDANGQFLRRWREFPRQPQHPTPPFTERLHAQMLAFELWKNAVVQARTTESARLIPQIGQMRATGLHGGQARIENRRLVADLFVAQAREGGLHLLTQASPPARSGPGSTFQTPPAPSVAPTRPAPPTPTPSPTLADIPGGRGRELSGIDGRTYQIGQLPQASAKALDNALKESDPSQLRRLLDAVCGQGATNCQGARLSETQAGELTLRIQMQILASRLQPEQIAPFLGVPASQLDLKSLSTSSWPATSPVLIGFQRNLPPAMLDSLVRLTGPEEPGGRPRGLNEQTAPGEGASGAPSLPSNFGNGGGPAPILPIPDVDRRGPESATGGGECRTPTNTATASTSDYQAKRLEVRRPDGSTAVPYCRDGFSDVVLLDTASASAELEVRVCSGVRIHPEWVLTAAHCVAQWSPTAGRVFLADPQGRRCLDKGDFSGRHPGEACNLSVLARGGRLAKAADFPNMSDVDLALVEVKLPPAGGGRVAGIFPTDNVVGLEVTLAGYGRTPNASVPGSFRVGWSQISRRPVAARSGQAIVNIKFMQQHFATNRLVSWSCGGDSGSPVFAGRIFGYSDESHNVAAIVTRGTLSDQAACASEVKAYDSMTVVSLSDPIVRQWIACHTAPQSGCPNRPN